MKRKWRLLLTPPLDAVTNMAIDAQLYRSHQVGIRRPYVFTAGSTPLSRSGRLIGWRSRSSGHTGAGLLSGA